MSSKPLVTVGIPTLNRSAWLQEAIESVMAQTYQDFRILISDNGSTDETPEVVERLGDNRIDYRRLEQGIGMTANFNRIINLTETEYLVVLPDDDLLRPRYLEKTIRAMSADPKLGVVHTGFDVIDNGGHVLESNNVLVGKGSGLSFESSRQFLHRSMRSGFLVCWSSALFRTKAVQATGGERDAEQPLADFSLFMRLALDWNYASIGLPLAAIRMHEDAATVQEGFGRFTGGPYAAAGDLYGRLHEQRRAFLTEFGPRLGRRSRRYKAIADRSYQRDQIGLLRLRPPPGSRRARGRALARLIRDRPRNLVEPVTWRLILTGFWR